MGRMNDVEFEHRAKFGNFEEVENQTTSFAVMVAEARRARESEKALHDAALLLVTGLEVPTEKMQDLLRLLDATNASDIPVRLTTKPFRYAGTLRWDPDGEKK